MDIKKMKMSLLSKKDIFQLLRYTLLSYFHGGVITSISSIPTLLVISWP